MPAVRKASKVVGTGVHVLKERGVSVDEAIRLEHAVDLVDNDFRLKYMFQYGLDDNSIHGCVGQGDPVSVGHKLRKGTPVDIESENVDIFCIIKII